MRSADRLRNCLLLEGFAIAPCGPVDPTPLRFLTGTFSLRDHPRWAVRKVPMRRPVTCGRTRWHRTIPSSYSAHAARDGNGFEPNQGGQPMAQDLSTSITRRSLVAGLALSAAPVALAGANNAYAQAKETPSEKSLYERLGGVFAI